MVILHIYGARPIFLLFCYHQDTVFDYCGIEMIIYKPILTHEKALCDNNIHTLQYG